MKACRRISYEKLERQMKSWRLSDRKQVSRRWKSRDLQTERCHSQMEIRWLTDRKQTLADGKHDTGRRKLYPANPNQIIISTVYSSTPMQAKLPKPQRKLAMEVLEEVAEDLVEEETDPGAQHLWAPACSSLSFTIMPGRKIYLL